MVEITYPVNVELTKEQMYRHTVARGESLKNLEDKTLIMVDEIVSYVSEKGDKIISMLGYQFNENTGTYDAALTHYVSNSGIFRDELAKIVEIFGSSGITLRIRKNVSKGGRTFVTCELA